MHKIGPQEPKRHIFDDQFYLENARNLRHYIYSFFFMLENIYHNFSEVDQTHKKLWILFQFSPGPRNLGQKVVEQFTKLSKIGFSMGCFTADFLRFFTEKRQNLAFGWTARYSPSDPSILGIFLKFTNFLRS